MELRVKFDLSDYCKTQIMIINPLTIPVEGEIVSIEWEHYINDQKEIDAIREIEQDSAFFAKILCRSYKKEYVEVFICLLSEFDYFEAVNDLKDYTSEFSKTGRLRSK